MPTQNYANHRQTVLMFHGVLFGMLVLTLGGSVTNLILSVKHGSGIYSPALLIVLTAAVIMLFIFCRSFALKAQDRAIRAEENLRHFALTGKLLDSRLTIRQVIGLRFAADQEFVALARRAAEESLSEDAIKRAVKNWKADTYRV
jgi:hypothetical protein